MLSDLMDYITLGERVTAHGKDWITLKELGRGLTLAVEANGDFPGQVMVIQLPVNYVKDFEAQ
jgi:hypothetical protein